VKRKTAQSVQQKLSAEKKD